MSKLLSKLLSYTTGKLCLVCPKVDEDERSSSDRRHPPDWTSLPSEILALIQSNLYFINDFNRFKAVCKPWELAAYPDDHIGFGSQFLVEKIPDQSRVTLLHPLAREPYCMDIPELRGASIRCSGDGWLLMSRASNGLFFFNPSTKSIIQWKNLPASCDRLKGITFTSAPTSDYCSVIALQMLGEVDVVSMVTTSRGDEFWTVFVLEGTYPGMFPSHCSSSTIFLNGALWCLCTYAEILVVDAKVPHHFKGFLPIEIEEPSSCEIYLLNFNGELMAVFVGRAGRDVAVLKWDNISMQWQVVRDLGEYMLFVSENASFAKKSVKDYMKNKIYFPRFHGKYGVFYSLEDRSYHTFGDHFSSRGLWNTVPLDCCCWIESDSSGFS